MLTAKSCLYLYHYQHDQATLTLVRVEGAQQGIPDSGLVDSDQVTWNLMPEQADSEPVSQWASHVLWIMFGRQGDQEMEVVMVTDVICVVYSVLCINQL